MKIKPIRESGGVMVELGPKEAAIPGPVPEHEAAPALVFKIKRVLVPIDFSHCSKKALQYAVPFANQFGARLCLLYVGQGYHLVPELSVVNLPEAQARMDATGKLATLAREEIGDKVSSELLVRKGHPATEILSAARELGADLIIISTHGYTGLKHVLLGSTAEHVVRQAPCPVLVVREQEHEFLAS
jgi:nucleotide-binding universal stress UspA family protein